MKPEISVLHSLARSGGTLVSKCLACMPDHVLLSEVHPRCAFFDPLSQAHEWFKLVDDVEVTRLRQGGQAPYMDAIRLIHDRCTRLGKKLVVRDWTHVDFTPGPYPVRPALQLSQVQALREYFEVRHIALVRHPIDSFLSLIRLQDHRGRLDIFTYLKGVRIFADIASTIGYIRFEDFCRSPADNLEKICFALKLSYDGSFSERFNHYSTITGENYAPDQILTLTGERMGERASSTIRLPPHREKYTTLARQVAGNPDYEATLKAFGYHSL